MNNKKEIDKCMYEAKEYQKDSKEKISALTGSFYLYISELFLFFNPQDNLVNIDNDTQKQKQELDVIKDEKYILG
jgi:hypothetical protein